MNLLISELTEHKKLLDKFSKLPADLRRHIQTFHKSTRPLPSCPYCNWTILKPQWSIITPCGFCFCVHEHYHFWLSHFRGSFFLSLLCYRNRLLKTWSKLIGVCLQAGFLWIPERSVKAFSIEALRVTPFSLFLETLFFILHFFYFIILHTNTN